MEYAIGVAASLVVEVVKKYWGTDTIMTHVALAIVSLAGALGYVWLSADTALWQSFLQVVIVASSFHNLVIRKFETS